ncbi:hypothetical protein [Flavobacterium sp.]|uniref:hypothetical protein n=1 Tax=Flavobacterium sp. TaxID=239 RepID=UPI0025B7AA21|nr:hypothetical protein [Flavobacterium sp.]|tara:strand:- start:520 stop:717 length:198 start_codon:yes stop_codon:yes gene_type:complete
MALNTIESIKHFAKYFDLMDTTVSISPVLSNEAKQKLQQNFKDCENILMNEVAKDVEVNDPVILS